MKKLGIVGTAFRGLNTDFDNVLTKELYFNKIYTKTLEVIDKLEPNTVVSGGAAGIDHLAPFLYLNSEVKKIQLYYPTTFIDTNSLIAKTLIKYHLNFSTIIFEDPYYSLSQLSNLFNNSKTTTNKTIVFSEEPVSTKYEGFFSRNKKIADNSNYLLVFSYFDNGNCLTNGTKSTIDYFLKNNSESKVIKIDIREL